MSWLRVGIGNSSGGWVREEQVAAVETQFLPSADTAVVITLLSGVRITSSVHPGPGSGHKAAAAMAELMELLNPPWIDAGG